VSIDIYLTKKPPLERSLYMISVRSTCTKFPKICRLYKDFNIDVLREIIVTEAEYNLAP